MEIREHKSWGHGLRPGTTHDINCLACQKEDNMIQPGIGVALVNRDATQTIYSMTDDDSRFVGEVTASADGITVTDARMNVLSPDSELYAAMVNGVSRYTEWASKSNPVCGYAAAHAMAGIPATTTIDCGPVGIVLACQACADFYARMS